MTWADAASIGVPLPGPEEEVMHAKDVAPDEIDRRLQDLMKPPGGA